MEAILRFREWGKHATTFKTISILIAICLILIGYFYGPMFTPFWQDDFSDIGYMLISLFLIAMFIERTNEIVLIAWRGKDRQEIDGRYILLKKKLDICIDDNDKSDIQDKFDKITIEIEKYKVETRSFALLTSLSFGLIISTVGVRSLEPLVDPAVFNNLDLYQIRFFNAIDIFITGALLGGGSNGIHKIMDLFFSTIDSKRDDIKKNR